MRKVDYKIKKLSVLYCLTLVMLCVACVAIAVPSENTVAYAESDIDYVIDPVPAESVEITVQDNKSTVQPGESVRLGVLLTPYYCNVQSIVYSFTEGAESASISPDGILTIKPTAPVGKILKVIANAEGTVSGEYSFTVVKIPVKSVVIDAGGATVIQEGAQLQLNHSVLPANASYPKVTYSITEGANYANIDGNGLIKINDIIDVSNAVVKVRAQADGVKSNELTFSIYVPTSTVRLSADNLTPKSSSVSGESVRLSTRVDIGATENNPSFIIISGQEFVESLNGGILTVKKGITAVNPIIKLKASCDGVESNVIELRVYIPVERISITSSVSRINEGANYQLSAPVIYPANATNKSYKFMVSSGQSYAGVSSTGLIKVNDNVGKPNASFKIKAVSTVDNAICNELTFSIFVPVKTVSLTSDKATLKSYLASGESLTLNPIINDDATDKTVRYVVASGSQYVESITGNILKLKAGIRNLNARIGVYFTCGGKTSNTVNVSIHIPVESFKLVTADGKDLNGQFLERGKTYNVTPKYNSDGIASVKGWTITDKDSRMNINNNSNTISINANVVAGSELVFGYKANDSSKNVSGTFKVKVKPLEGTFSVEYGCDSSGTQLDQDTPQLMAGRSATFNVYYTENGNKVLAGNYGVSVTLPVKSSNFTYAIHGSNVSFGVLSSVSGRNNYITYEITIIDGTSKYKMAGKSVQIFKPVTNAWYIVVPSRLTSERTELTLGGLNADSTYTADNVIYSVPSGKGYSISKVGGKFYLNAAVSAADKIEITYNFAQKYNGINVNTTAKRRSVDRGFVNSVAHLRALSGKTGTYVMTRNIALTGQWTPLTSFKGILNGQNYTIENLLIAIADAPASNVINYGLFKINEGTVKNLNFKNVSTISNIQHSGDWIHVGMVCGVNKGTIENVKVQGNITVKRNIACVGGMVGLNESNGMIRNCTMGYISNSTFWTNADTGGIVGNNKGNVVNCTTKNTTFKYYDSYNNRSIGGIVGFNAGIINGGTVIKNHFWIYGYNVNGNLDPVMGMVVGYLQSGSTIKGYLKGANNTLDFGIVPSKNRNHLFNGYWGERGQTENGVNLLYTV